MSDVLPSANWYEDPEDPLQWRYWDGSTWTDFRHPHAYLNVDGTSQTSGWNGDRFDPKY